MALLFGDFIESGFVCYVNSEVQVPQTTFWFKVDKLGRCKAISLLVVEKGT